MYRLPDRFSVSQLAFKHRENENLRQRIIVVASPLSFLSTLFLYFESTPTICQPSLSISLHPL